jgi:hypothetical protein
MANNYIQQTSTLSAVMPGIISDQQQQSNQFSSIITDITNLFHAVNGLNGNGTTGYSWFSTQNVITAQRAYGSIYKNTTGKTMMVTVTSHVSSASSVKAYTDSSLNPTTEVGATDIATTNNPLTFMVLNNNNYTLTTTGTVVLVCWTEWN